MFFDSAVFRLWLLVCVLINEPSYYPGYLLSSRNVYTDTHIKRYLQYIDWIARCWKDCRFFFGLVILSISIKMYTMWMIKKRQTKSRAYCVLSFYKHWEGNPIFMRVCGSVCVCVCLWVCVLCAHLSFDNIRLKLDTRHSICSVVIVGGCSNFYMCASLFIVRPNGFRNQAKR